MAYVDIYGNEIQAYTAGLPPVESLTTASATNATATVLDAVTVRANSILVVVTSAGVTAGDVQLQGSLDGVNFYAIGSALAVSAANTVYTGTSTTRARYFRAVVSTTITGGTVSAWIGATD